ncbi:pentapeptide repeat-containing protein [Nostoc sp. CMAA1605]|nr:pentapeptide repeat-containing protein [Nostoc sp. CMAA1605]
MLNIIIDFYHQSTKTIIHNQLSILNIIQNIDFPQNISPDVIRQKCHLVTQYWQQQKTVEFLATITQLENLARNYSQYSWLILEFLSDFVRQHTKINPSSTHQIRAEIQAILTVITQIHRQPETENAQLDLSHTDLRGANLQKANLEWANLYHVNLAGANLSQANLSGAILSAANLSGANLANANLSGAILSAANFSQANLTSANLYQANLYLANLQQANLDETILDKANLREAKFT